MLKKTPADYQRAYRERHRERYQTPEARAKAAAQMRKWRAVNRDRVETTRRARYHKLRAEALDAYGNKCVCCGETYPHFLSFDHKNGGGKKDRVKGFKGGGRNWYLHLLREHPNDIQVLCHNCNLAKGFYGECPHQLERTRSEKS